MSNSNLPPGCSSPDGGIDHAWESALDDLTVDVTTEELVALRKILPSLRLVMRDQYHAGRRDAELDALNTETEDEEA